MGMGIGDWGLGQIPNPQIYNKIYEIIYIKKEKNILIINLSKT